MKVENLSQNYVGLRRSYRKSGMPSALYSHSNVNPQFTGNYVKAAKTGSDFILDLIPGKKAIEKMKKLDVLKGELGGILITALGTGLVAPIFIAYNPFVKAPKDATPEEKQEVENTKQYTAMRQPISAVLAALFQAGVLNPIDKCLDKWTNDSDYSKNVRVDLDQSALNKESYLKRIIAKEMKQEVKDGKATYSSKKLFEEELAKRVKDAQEKQISDLAKDLNETGRIKIGQRFMDDKTVAEFINKQLDSYIKSAQKLKVDDTGIDYEKLKGQLDKLKKGASIDLEKFGIEQSGIGFYTERARMIMDNEEAINRLFDKNVLPKGEKELEAYLKGLLSTSESADMKVLIQEVLDHDPLVRESRCQRTLERIDKIKRACNGDYSPKAYLQSMLDRNSEVDRLIKSLEGTRIADTTQVKGKDITQVLDEIVKKCHFDVNNKRIADVLDGSGVFQSNREDLVKKVSEDVIKQYKKFIEKNYKGINQITKVAIGVGITLPITCTALNWVYPRLMELCFPKLAGIKKDKPAVENQEGGAK